MEDAEALQKTATDKKAPREGFTKELAQLKSTVAGVRRVDCKIEEVRKSFTDRPRRGHVAERASNACRYGEDEFRHGCA